MKVLAIYSSPQEYGDPLLDFIDLNSGQVIHTVSMVGAEDPELEKLEWDEPTGKFESYHIGFIPPSKLNEYEIGKRYGFGIIVKSKITRDDFFPDKELYEARITVEEYVHKWDYHYNPELDTFDKYLKSIGIDIPWNSSERQDIRTLIPMIGEALGFEIVNTLYY